MAYSQSLVVPAANLASDLTGFVVRLDLADLSAAFWSSVAADGGDIRIRQAGSDLPFDLVIFDTVGSTGELFFKADLSATADNSFTVEVVTGATMPAVTDPIGRNAVWSDYDAVVLGDKTINRTGGTAPIEVGTVTQASDGWLDMTAAAGNLYVAGAPTRTQWTIGVTTYSTDSTTANKGHASYTLQGSTNNANRLSMVDNNGDTRGVWNSSDGWRTYGAVARNVNERRVVVNDATASCRAYLNGALAMTDNAVAQRPAGGSPSDFVIGAADRSGTERWQGKLNYAYLRNGLLSADWLKAEYDSWEANAFSTIDYFGIVKIADQTGAVGDSVALQPSVTGGTAPYSWSASSLPSGLSIDPVSGQISGNLTASANYSATITVTDANSATANFTFDWLVGDTQYQAEVLVDAPWGFWPGLPSGSNLADASPNLHDLSLTGIGISMLTAPDGGTALAWSNTYGHNATTINSDPDQTFECWVYLDALPSVETYLYTFGNGINGNGGYSSTTIKTDGTVSAQCWTSSSHYTVSPSPLSLKRWHHIVVTSSDLMRLYIDGVMVATGAAMGGGWNRSFYMPGTQNIKIAYPAFYYNLALSDSRILTHYQIGSDDKKPPEIASAYGQNNSGDLVVNYGLSQGAGVDVTIDVTGDFSQSVDVGIGPSGQFTLSGLTPDQLYQLALTPTNVYGTGSAYDLNAKLTSNPFDQIIEADRPAVFLDLQETTGTIAYDRFGDPQNGTYAGSVGLNDNSNPIPPNTNIDKQVKLDGSTGYLQLAGGSWLTPSQGFTFEGCFYIRTWADWARIFDLASSPGVDDMYLAANNGGSMTLKVAGTAITFARFQTGQWFHLMVTISSTGVAKIYLNGKSYASGTVGAPIDGVRDYQYVGKSAYAADPYLAASLSHIVIYNRVLSSFAAAGHAAAAIPATAAQSGAFYATENIGITLAPKLLAFTTAAYENIGIKVTPNRLATTNATENILARTAMRGWGLPMSK